MDNRCVEETLTYEQWRDSLIEKCVNSEYWNVINRLYEICRNQENNSEKKLLIDLTLIVLNEVNEEGKQISEEAKELLVFGDKCNFCHWPIPLDSE